MELKFYQPIKKIPELQSINTIDVAKHKAKEATAIMLLDADFMSSIKSYSNTYVLVWHYGLYAKMSPINKITYKDLGYPGSLIMNYMNSIDGDPREALCQQFGGSPATAECSIGIHNLKSNEIYSTTSSASGYIPIKPSSNINTINCGWNNCFVPNSEFIEKTIFRFSMKNLSDTTTFIDIIRKMALISAIDAIAYDISIGRIIS